MLSNGYLQPAGRVEADAAAARNARSAALALQERQILAQEQTLKAAADSVSTTYHYTIGPDGQRYITSAEVTVAGDERVLDGIPGGVKREVSNDGDPTTKSTKFFSHVHGSDKGDDEKTAKEASQEREGQSEKLSDQIEESGIVGELKQTEREVVAHEAAHRAVGGRFAGPVSYTYTEGPDGKKYITGGEVPINVPATDDPEETARNMEQVARAALAPADPSGQDLSVAAQAAAAAAQARQQIASRGGENRDGENSADDAGQKTDAAFPHEGAASVRADIRFERIQSGEEAQIEQEATIAADEVMDAYARTASRHGLWTIERGFEPAAAAAGADGHVFEEQSRNVDIAA
jgi:hypothetical protein